MHAHLEGRFCIKWQSNLAEHDERASTRLLQDDLHWKMSDRRARTIGRATGNTRASCKGAGGDMIGLFLRGVAIFCGLTAFAAYAVVPPQPSRKPVFEGLMSAEPQQSSDKQISEAKSKRLLMVLSGNTHAAIDYQKKSIDAIVAAMRDPAQKAAVAKSGDLQPIVNDLVTELKNRFHAVALGNDLSALPSGSADTAVVVDMSFYNAAYGGQSSKATIGLHFLDATGRKVCSIVGEGEQRIGGMGAREDYLPISRENALRDLTSKIPLCVTP
jgi:hypothetical protein